jgi:hypothetical protein
MRESVPLVPSCGWRRLATNEGPPPLGQATGPVVATLARRRTGRVHRPPTPFCGYPNDHSAENSRSPTADLVRFRTEFLRNKPSKFDFIPVTSWPPAVQLTFHERSPGRPFTGGPSQVFTRLIAPMVKSTKPEKLNRQDLNALARANAEALYQALAGIPLSERPRSPNPPGKTRKRINLPNKPWQFPQS